MWRARREEPDLLTAKPRWVHLGAHLLYLAHVRVLVELKEEPHVREAIQTLEGSCRLHDRGVERQSGSRCWDEQPLARCTSPLHEARRKATNGPVCARQLGCTATCKLLLVLRLVVLPLN